MVHLVKKIIRFITFDSHRNSKDELCRQLANCQHIALTSDRQTDDFRKIAYVTVIAHYFDAQLNLQPSVLNTCAVEEKKTAEVLGKVVEEVIVSKVSTVTNNASNIMAAFRNRCRHILCFAHCLNFVVVDMLQTDNADFQTMLTNSKSFVRHFKHAGLQQKLKTALKQ